MRTIIFFFFLSLPAYAQSPENVLLVVNETSPVSLEIGQYYAEKRGLPRDQVLRIRCSVDDEIARQGYERRIEAPITSWLARNSGHDRILYIALTKGIPLRIAGTSGPEGTVASVDSELTLLYRKLSGIPVPSGGRVNNPYFLGDRTLLQARPFTHEDQDIYLVCRLDGYSFDDIRRLVDKGLAPVREGKILLDQKAAAADERGNGWLRSAADRLQTKGYADRVVLESSAEVLKGVDGVLGYYSWGSNDLAIRIRDFGFSFVPGALAGMFVSSDGRTFKEPPSDWQVGPWDGSSPSFEGSPQSLAGDLIHQGVTGIAAHVAEPYLEGTIRPQILFPAYFAGFNLIESYYLAMPYLSWQTIVVGDPLCAPFRAAPLSADKVDPGIDEETELPKWFSIRRSRGLSIQAYQKAGVHPDAVKAVLRAEVRMAKGDQAGARRALETATSLDSRLLSGQTLLALLYEQYGEYDKAIERYRRILELTPDNALVLNNLAYGVAVRQGKPQEALPLAERAYSLAKGSASIADTLAWIHHLLGNDNKAAPLLALAAQGAPQNAEIHLHLAIVSAAIGSIPQAMASLSRALELDPTLDGRDDVRQLRETISKQP